MTKGNTVEAAGFEWRGGISHGGVLLAVGWVGYK